MKNLNLLKLKSFVFVLLTMMFVLTGCLSGRRYEQAYGQTTQPPYLYLKAGQPYQPVRDEKWVSPRVLEGKDQTILELSKALERAGVKPFLPPPLPPD